MKLLFVFVFLINGLSFSLHLSKIDARPDPSSSSVSPSPVSSPTSPFSVSMAAFTPGTSVEEEEEGHRPMDSRKKLLIALLAAVASLGAIVLPVICLWNCRRRKRYLKSPSKRDSISSSISVAPVLGRYSSTKRKPTKRTVSVMDYKVLEAATKSFQEGSILGAGGFGCVYKGRLENNTSIAVKKLQGDSQDPIREFETEVNLLSKIQHPNIISLLGYCVHGETRLLVYEFMQNGSLETQLHGPSQGSALTWPIRMKIALDTARGLEYLHEGCNPQVIHRDMKSSNILLDSNFSAKLSDFGLAVTSRTKKSSNIKLSGTVGYVAPEYLQDGKLTDKSDVYAFGVVLLELLLGRKAIEKLAPTECQSIITWAMPQLTDRSKLPTIIDPVIRNKVDPKHLFQVAAVAVLCVQPEPSYRPLITDVLYSLVPLVPMELGGTLVQVLPPKAATDEAVLPPA